MTSAAWILLAGAVIGHGLTVIALLHLRLSMAPVARHAVSAMVWYALLIATSLLGSLAPALWLLTASFAFAVMAYVFGYSAVYKSLSLQLLVLLANDDPSGVPLPEIERRVARASFRARAEMLVATGMVVHGRSGFELSEQGRTIAGRLARLRSFFGIHTAGLYFTAPPTDARR